MSRQAFDKELALQVGAAFRAVRLQRKLSQPKAAELIGLSRWYWNRIERGRCIPSVAIWFRLIGRFAPPVQCSYLMPEGRITISINGDEAEIQKHIENLGLAVVQDRPQPANADCEARR